MYFFSGFYNNLEFFAKSDGRKGTMELLCQNKKNVLIYVENCTFSRFNTALEEDTLYHINMDGITVSQIYLCGNENILSTGVKFLDIESENMELFHADLLDTPYREQYHFTPFNNWMNDPNGLCWHKGYYHLFFQANPHEQKWGNMYWGHAVSKELIHWNYLPYIFEPQKKILESKTMIGGAFSGSAISTNEGIRFFFTRDEEIKGNPKETKQSQMTAISLDGITASDEKMIIPAGSVPGVGTDFRDPKVTNIDGKWYMVVAGCYYNVPSILLFISSDLVHWEFKHPLLQHSQIETTGFECPDFFRLTNKNVVIASLMKMKTDNGVKQPVYYYIGDWNGKEFKVLKSEPVDYGSNFYAPQSFEHNGRRIMLAWICDWDMEHQVIPYGVYGSLTIPRELTVKNNKLYQKPIREIYELMGEILYSGIQISDMSVKIEGNTYYCKVLLTGDTDYDILLAQDGKDYIKIIGTARKLELISTKNKCRNSRFLIETEQIEKIEIFMDRRVTELYLNDGEKTITKIFVNNSSDGVLKAHFGKKENISNLLVRKVNSIWN